MRTLALSSVIGLLLIFHTAAAQDRKPRTADPTASSSQVPTEQQSKAQAAERKKADELAKARQRRMDKLSRSVCTGC